MYYLIMLTTVYGKLHISVIKRFLNNFGTIYEGSFIVTV